ncbi:MAG: F0F1 ATP synthase subunit A [Candidatus Promineifilaceae bacterium]
MAFLNPSKRRFWILLAVIGMFALPSILPPVRPFIQLPGEVYPGTEAFLGGWTNTFSASLLTWAIVMILAFSLRAGSRSADEVPSGFYNFFEMLIEGAYNFAANIAGHSKVKDFFPLFMTYIMVIVIGNWLGLVPGFDSIGIWENKAVFEFHKAEAAHQDHPEDVLGLVDAENKGDLKNGMWLISKEAFADDDAAIETHTLEIETHGEDSHGTIEFVEKEGLNPEAADWTIVPFFRPAATDLNMTFAFAIIAMVMVQYFGIRYLGPRDYFSKFFPFIGKGWGAQVAKNPIKAIDPIVGILELVSEISKVISFAFRLLGNIFAGMVLLFVMAYLLPAANIAFFGLEFFVGLIQGAVFGLLMLIFMVSATVSHSDHGDDHH